MKKLKRDLRKCPHCTGKYRGQLALRECGFYDAAAAPAISRRDKQPICWACSRAEALADYAGLDDDQARTVTEQDKQEALRLPPGLFWGGMQCPTGGLDQYLKDWETAYAMIREELVT